jgi:uncharacterized protein YndB with AHSA1/START domain
VEKKVQGGNELLIDANPEQIWAVLDDSSRVPEYMHAVKSIDTAPGSSEYVGSTRSCHVEMQGKRGEVVERCVELVRNERLTHVMERDAFGFSRFFDDFGFSFILEPSPGGRTLVRLEGFYREKGLRGRVLNELMMKRKLDALRGRVLADLKRLVEQPDAASETRAAQLAKNP